MTDQQETEALAWLNTLDIQSVRECPASEEYDDDSITLLIHYYFPHEFSVYNDDTQKNKIYYPVSEISITEKADGSCYLMIYNTDRVLLHSAELTNRNFRVYRPKA